MHKVILYDEAKLESDAGSEETSAYFGKRSSPPHGSWEDPPACAGRFMNRPYDLFPRRDPAERGVLPDADLTPAAGRL